MSKYPIFLELNEKTVLIVGAGKVASRKVGLLYEAGAKIRVVAKFLSEDFKAKAIDYCKEIIEEPYNQSHLEGALLVIAATDDEEVNTQIYNDCKTKRIFCNTVDEPKLCDFYVPALVKRGPLQIAISTDGECPAYASKLRETIGEMITEKHGEFVSAMGQVRKLASKLVDDPNERKTLLYRLAQKDSFEFFCKNDAETWNGWAMGIIKSNV